MSTHKLTANLHGFEHPINSINQAFIDYAGNNRTVLDVGCAYGEVAKACVKAGAKNVWALDKELEHVKGLYANQVAWRHGEFPNDFEWMFPREGFNAIHMSHILEYLNPRETETGLKLVHKWLKPGGKLFINVYTPRIADFNHARWHLEHYHRCVDRPIAWPGYIEHFRSWWANPEHDEHPIINVHLHERGTLLPYLEKLGFKIEYGEYMDGRKEGGYPRCYSEGEELLGIIAVKE